MKKYILKGFWKFIRYSIKSILRTAGFFIFFAGDSDRSKKELNKVLNTNPAHRYIIYFLILLFFSLLVAVIFGPYASQHILKNPTTFNISTVTEKVKVVTRDVPMSSWPVEDVKLSKDCSDEKVQHETFTGSIKINPSVQITFTRIADGGLSVTMYRNKNKSLNDPDGDKDNYSVGDLYDEDDEYSESLTNCAFFEINDIAERIKLGKSIVLPITGEIEAGNEIRFLTQQKNPVLREGKITILARSFMVGENYIVGPFDLEMGDSFEIQKTEIEKNSVPSQGFVLVNEKPAINLVFRAEGIRGLIKRYQSEDYELKNSYWSKLYNDEALYLSWALIIILFNIIRVYLRFLVN